MAEDLIDEIMINIEPVVIGNGIPLFAESDIEKRLSFIESVRIADDILQVKYKVNKNWKIFFTSPNTAYPVPLRSTQMLRTSDDADTLHVINFLIICFLWLEIGDWKFSKQPEKTHILAKQDIVDTTMSA